MALMSIFMTMPVEEVSGRQCNEFVQGVVKDHALIFSGNV